MSLISIRRNMTRAVCLSLTGLLAVVPFACGKRNRTIASSNASESSVVKAPLQLSEKALKQVITQLNRLKPTDRAFDPNSIKKIYSDQKEWLQLDEYKADLHIALASALERSAKLVGRPDLQEISNLAFRQIIEYTKGRTQLRASSNYCAQLLRQDRPVEAVEVMENVGAILNDKSLDTIARSRSLYNYGRALALSGNLERAYDTLKKSLEADPTFTKAAQAAGDIALKSPHETIGIPLVVELTNGQLERFDYEGAAQNLRKAMVEEDWIDHPHYPRLLGQLVRYFTTARIEPEVFQRDWRRFLIRVWQRCGSDSRWMIDSIQIIYAGRLEMVGIIPEEIRDFHANWEKATGITGPEADLGFLSSFIKMIGDYYYRQGDEEGLEKSLICYCHAWGLNVENMDAGLYLANVLLYDLKEGERRLDQKYGILDAFIDQLFVSKNREYRRNLGKDWERILKCHIILAKIFERLGRWGSDWDPQLDARTALFQWQLALNALEQLDESASATKELFRPEVVKGIQEARKHL